MVYSARELIAGAPGRRLVEESGSWEAAMELIRGQVLAHTSEEGAGADMRASFQCTMTLAFPNGKKVTATDVLNGKLVWPPRGDVTPGSGFYSLFVAEGEVQTLQVPRRVTLNMKKNRENRY